MFDVWFWLLKSFIPSGINVIDHLWFHWPSAPTFSYICWNIFMLARFTIHHNRDTYPFNLNFWWIYFLLTQYWNILMTCLIFLNIFKFIRFLMLVIYITVLLKIGRLFQPDLLWFIENKYHHFSKYSGYSHISEKY